MIRSITAILILSFLLACSFPALADQTGTETAGQVQADSSMAFEWAGVFALDIHKKRISSPFLWNAAQADEWSAGRLGVDLRYFPSTISEVMVRLAARDAESTSRDHNGSVFLEQGHASLAIESLFLDLNLFMRERVYRSGNKLILPVSSDALFLEDSGEGILLSFDPGRVFGISLIASSLPDRTSQVNRGGLPVLQGWGGSYNLVTIRSAAGPVDAGFFISESRSPVVGNGVLSGMDLGLTAGRYRFQLEMARYSEGRVGELSTTLLPSLDPGGVEAGRFNRLFSSEDAFSMELHGLSFRSEKLGTAGLIPGYLYSGRDFIALPGEIERGRIESRLTAWWRHPQSALSVYLHAADYYLDGSEFSGKSLRTVMRARFRRGIETEAGLILRDENDPSAVVSLLEDSEDTRIKATARLDGPGGVNRLSFITEGHLNLTGSIAVRSVLYLDPSNRNLYSMQIEYRSGRRFLFRAGLGTFIPTDQSSAMMYDHSPGSTEKERFVSVFTRIALGEH